MYSIEELIKTFEEHAVTARKNSKEMLKEFLKNNPGEPVPAWYLDEFVLPQALADMCKEIVRIKSSVREP